MPTQNSVTNVTNKEELALLKLQIDAQREANRKADIERKIQTKADKEAQKEANRKEAIRKAEIKQQQKARRDAIHSNSSPEKKHRKSFVEWAEKNFSTFPELDFDGEFPKLKPCLDNFEYMLYNYSLSISFDMIRRKPDITLPFDSPYSMEHTEEALLSDMVDLCEILGIKAGVQRVASWMNNIADKNRFNPIAEYLERCYQTHTKGTTELEKYLDCYQFTGNVELSKKLFTKWLIQCVAMPHNDGSFGAVGILILQGEQGISKTRAYTHLCKDVPRYFKEGDSLDPSNKDDIEQATTKWIVELGEIESTTTKKDTELLKAFITKNIDQYRVAYGRGSKEIPRRTSFCGSANSNEILVDTVNRRFWICPVLSIDWGKMESIDIGQLWGEIYTMWLENKQGFRITKEEEATLQASNQHHRKETAEEIMLRDTFNFDSNPDTWFEWLSNSEICSRLSANSNKTTISPNKVGKALKTIFPEYSKCGKFFNTNGRKYRLPKCKISPEDFAPPTPQFE